MITLFILKENKFINGVNENNGTMLLNHYFVLEPSLLMIGQKERMEDSVFKLHFQSYE